MMTLDPATPSSGTGTVLTTAVTIAGGGSFGSKVPGPPLITKVAVVALVEAGGIMDLAGDAMRSLTPAAGVSMLPARGLFCLLPRFRKSKFSLPVFLSFSSFESAITSFNCRFSSSYYFFVDSS